MTGQTALPCAGHPMTPSNAVLTGELLMACGPRRGGVHRRAVPGAGELAGVQSAVALVWGFGQSVEFCN